MSKKERGRPMCSHHVRIVPEYRDNADMEKLGEGSDLGSSEYCREEKGGAKALRTRCPHTLRFVPCGRSRKEGGMT